MEETDDGSFCCSTLMERILVSSRVVIGREINVRSRLHIAGGKERRATNSLLHTVIPLWDEAGEELIQHLSRPREVQCNCEWKLHQDAVYWIRLARAQEKGLQFWQTRSLAIHVHESVPGCIGN